MMKTRQPCLCWTAYCAALRASGGPSPDVGAPQTTIILLPATPRRSIPLVMSVAWLSARPNSKFMVFVTKSIRILTSSATVFNHVMHENVPPTLHKTASSR
jgi:hypothetical protein